MGVGKGLTQEPRSTKIEKYFPEAPVRIAFSITCLAGSATFRETLIYLKVNIYFTLKKEKKRDIHRKGLLNKNMQLYIIWLGVQFY